MNNLPLYSQLLLQGLGVSLVITIASVLLGMGMGLLFLFQVFRQGWASKAVIAYINLIRGLPLFVLILTAYMMLKPYLAPFNAIADERILAAILMIAVSASIYFFEIFRSAYNFIPVQQLDSAKAFRLSNWRIFKDIIVPQIFTKAKNPLIKQSLIFFNESSLVYVIGVNDFFGVAVKLGEQTNRIGTSLFLIALFYVSIGWIYQKWILKNKP